MSILGKLISLKDLLINQIKALEVAQKTKRKHSLSPWQKKQKGNAYEFFVGKYFKEKGYKIFYNGINKGFKDGGIDLVAYKENEVLLMQCKNWDKWKINKELLEKFSKNCDNYAKYHHKQMSNKKIKKLFVASKINTTKEALGELFNYECEVKFLHLPFEEELK